MVDLTDCKIIIIDDDPDIIDMLCMFFRSNNMQAVGVRNGAEGLDLIASFKPDIIILDLIMPGIDGMSFMEKVHAGNQLSPPIIMLTEKNSLEDKITGLSAGADDYISKPFSLEELLARVKAVLRRYRPENKILSEPDSITIGSVTINNLTRDVALNNNQAISLTKTEFNLLFYLAKRKGQAVNRKNILMDVLEYKPDSQTKALAMHIANIRKKFKHYEINDIKIEAVPGVGYKLTD